MEDLVTIAEVKGHEADYIKSVLESHGVTVFVDNANMNYMTRLQMVPAKIQVPKDQADNAQKVMQTIGKQEDKPGIELDEYSDWIRTHRFKKTMSILKVVGSALFVVGLFLFVTGLPTVTVNDVMEDATRTTEPDGPRTNMSYGDARRQQQEINASRFNRSVFGIILAGFGMLLLSIPLSKYLPNRSKGREYIGNKFPSQIQNRPNKSICRTENSDWICPKCEEQLDGLFDACSQCGTKKDVSSSSEQ